MAESIEDLDKVQLGKFSDEKNLDKHDKKLVDMFKKRKLIQQSTLKSYKVTKGANFAPQREKLETNLTAEMLRTGSW